MVMRWLLILLLVAQTVGAYEIDTDNNGAVDLNRGGTNAVTAAGARAAFDVPSTGEMAAAVGAVTADSLGLGNVDNTADIDKPISTAVQAELNERVPRVANLAALQLLDGSSGQVVYVVGRTTDGDGYEGHFQWVIGDQSANVATDTQSGVWVAGTDGTGAAGAWKRQHEDRFYPEWFGAVGNDIPTGEVGSAQIYGTDDATAIQALFDYVDGSENWYLTRHIVFERGYYVGSTVTLDTAHNITVSGHGVIRGNLTAPVVRVTNSQWVRWGGVDVRNDSTAAGSIALKIDLTYISKFFDCRIFGGEIGIDHDGNNNVFDHINFRYSGTLWKGGRAGNNLSNLMTGCSLEKSTVRAIYHGTTGGTGGQLTVNACYFEQNAEGDIYVENSGATHINNSYFTVEDTKPVLTFAGSNLSRQTVTFNDNTVLAQLGQAGYVFKYATAAKNKLTYRNIITDVSNSVGTVTTYDVAAYEGVYGVNTAARDSINVLNHNFYFATAGVVNDWTSIGGADVAQIADQSMFGGGFAAEKTDNSSFYRTIKVKPNTLYRIRTYAVGNAGSTPTFRMFNTAGTAGYGAASNAGNDSTVTLLEKYWYSQSVEECRIYLQPGGAAGAKFSNVVIEDITNS